MGREESKDCTICTTGANIEQKISKDKYNAHSKVAKWICQLSCHNFFYDQSSTSNYINPLDIDLKEQPAHCSHVEAKHDGKTWYYDIKKYLETGIYLEDATSNQKKAIHWLSNNLFLSGEILCRSPDLTRRFHGIYKTSWGSTCWSLGPHMNGLTLAK